jgi:DNA-binding NtrC family response regulator
MGRIIMRILVVDDEIMQLKNLKIGLDTEGHSVVTAQSAEEALEQVKKTGAVPFDLIITDYLMPDISGLDLLKALREKEPFIPVILMTAYGKKDLVIEAMQHQCSGFIEKPFSLEQMVIEISRVKSHKLHNGSSQALDKHLAQIVHQINNPLMCITGNAQLALHFQTDSDALNRRLEAIITATDKIVEISNQIMNRGMAKEMKDEMERVA